jgi:cytochrome c-type biogenesis protein CcmE
MHKNKTPIIIITGVTVLIVAALIYSSIDFNNPATNSVNSEVKLVAVENVVENPEEFAGLINVEGTVKEILDNKKFFTLGCEDACVNLPVSYKGEIPKLESNIIALGEVKKDVDGKYFFDAMEIKYK